MSTSEQRSQWREFFRQGNVLELPTDAGMLRARLAGNAATLVVTLVLCVLVAGSIVAAVLTVFGQFIAFLLLGILFAALLLLTATLLRTRRRLEAAAGSAQYLAVSPQGLRIADAVDVPWMAVLGVVSVDGRGRGLPAAHRAGVADAEVVIGLKAGVARQLREVAGPRLKGLFEVIGDGGGVRVPLDRVLLREHVDQVFAGLEALLPVVGVGHVDSFADVRSAVMTVLSGKRLPVNPDTAAEAARDVAHQPEAAAPPPPPPPALPPESPADDGAFVRVDELARLLLTTEEQEQFRAAGTLLATAGAEAFTERYPDLDDGFSDDGPDQLTILLGIGQARYPATIGWCDSRGQDDDGQVLSSLEESCRRRGLPVPPWPDSLRDELDPVALFAGADTALSAVGARLIFIDDDSDVYRFAPVTASDLDVYRGRAGEGFTLQSMEWLAPAASGPVAAVAPEISPQASGVQAPQHADNGLYSQPFGPVDAVPIIDGANIIGYLHHGFGLEAHRGGVHHAAYFWKIPHGDTTRMIKDLADRGIPASEGIPTLYGTMTENGLRIGKVPTRYPSFAALDRVAFPQAYKLARNSTPEQIREQTSGYGMAVRNYIDAALRGEIRMTEQWAALTADVDAALNRHPVATARTVAVRIAEEEFVGGVHEGMRAFFPAHLQVRDLADAAAATGFGVLVHLSVPEGTGLLPVAPDYRDERPLLLLPRGLTVVITRADRGASAIEARVESVTAAPVRVGDFQGQERLLRDTRADEEYFARQLVNAGSSGRFDEHLLFWRERKSDEKYPPIHGRDALSHRWRALSIMYSQGVPAEELRAYFVGTLAVWERGEEIRRDHWHSATDEIFRTHKDLYRYWLLFVSFAVAFRVDEATFDRAVAAAEFGWGDRLIDRLIHSRRPSHPIGEDLRFPRIVARLDKAFTAADPEVPLADYLDRWYSLWKGVEWWDTHRALSGGYYGYWAFEMLGVVEALKVDDTRLREMEYYPRDLTGLE